MRKCALLLALIAVPVLLLGRGTGLLAGETRDKKTITLAERQDKARKEMNKLLQRIRDIAERLRERGDAYQADKLDEAFTKIQEVGLLSNMRKVVDTLRQARLWEAIDQQKEVMEKIDKVLDILLDRKSYEELDKNAKELDKVQQSLQDLKEEQQKHIDKLDRLTKEGRAEISEDVKAAAKAIEDLMARQRAVIQRTRAADVEESLKAADRAIANLDKLVAEQKELLERTRNTEGLTKQEADLLNEALDNLDALTETQDRASRVAAKKGASPDLDDMARALDRAKKEQGSLDTANRAEMGRAGKKGLFGVRQDLQDLMDEQRAVKELTRAAGELDAIAGAQAEIADRAGKDPTWAKERAGAQGKAADQLRRVVSPSLVRAMEDSGLRPEEREALKVASEASARAREHLKASSRAATEGDGGETVAKEAKKALQALEEAREALAPVVGKNWENLKKRQDGLAKKAEALASKVAVSKDDAMGMDPQARVKREHASASVKSAGKKMLEAGSEIQGKNTGEATGRQSEALGELLKASRLIDEVLEEKTPGTQALAERQGKLGAEVTELGEELRKAADDRPRGPKGQVGSSLKQAAEKALEAGMHEAQSAAELDEGRNHEGDRSQKKAGAALNGATKALAEAIRKASGKEGREDLAKTEAAASKKAAEVAKKVSVAANTLKNRGAEARGAKMEALAGEVSKASKAAQEAGKASEAGDVSRAAEKAEQAREALAKARDELAEFLKTARPELGAEAKAQENLKNAAKKVSEDLSEITKGQPGAPGMNEARQASHQTQGASSNMGKASKKLEAGQPREAEVRQKEALKNLEEARKAAEAMKASLMKKSDPEREKLAKQQLRLKEESEKVAKKLEDMARKSESSGASGSSAKKASSSMKKAGGHMKKGSENLVNRNFPKTREEQRRALKAMEEARREVKKLEDEAVRRAKERELNALVREQEGTEEKTKLTEQELEKLRRLLEARDVGRAAQAMNQAKHKVSKMDLIPGKDKMEEARDFLEKAEEAVKEQQRRYQQLAQEQLIFQIKTMLREILDEQKKVNGLVEEMWGRLKAGKRLQRGHVRAVLKASDAQENLAKRMVEIEKKIEKQASVFAWVARSVSEDMRSVRDLLRDNPPDVSPFTQGLCREIVSRIFELLEAFKLELKKRQKPPGKPKGGGGRPRLVPPLAELQMLRTLQTQIRGNTESLVKTVKENKDLTNIQKIILERLAHRQGNVTDVMRRFIQSLTREGDPGSRR